MVEEKYKAAEVRPMRDAAGKIRAYQAIIRFKEYNPLYREKPEGEDTRRASEKRRELWKQRTRVINVTRKNAAMREAERLRQEWNEEAAKPEASGIMLSDYVNAFLDGHDVEPSTMRTYRKSARHIAAAFEGVRIGELSGGDIQKWITRMRKRGVSLSVQGQDFRLLKMIVTSAYELGDIEENPFRGVKPPKREAPPVNSLTRESRQKLLDALGGMEPTRIVTACYVALYMGLRREEICALRWGRIDFEKNELTICEAVGESNGGTYLKPTKTKSSLRTLAIPEKAREALKAREKFVRKELVAAGVEDDADYFDQLFVIGGLTPDEWGNPTRITKEWGALREMLGLEGTEKKPTFHDLRHTFATVGVAETNADIKSIASYMGHSNIAVTLNTYASADPHAIAATADAMNDAM